MKEKLKLIQFFLVRVIFFLMKNLKFMKFIIKVL